MNSTTRLIFLFNNALSKKKMVDMIRKKNCLTNVSNYQIISKIPNGSYLLIMYNHYILTFTLIK